MNIIFDYDGTIHNTAYIYCKGFRKAYDYLVSKGSAPSRELDDKKITSYLGMSPVTAWKKELPYLDDISIEDAIKITGDEMARLVKDGKSKLYDNALETICALKEKEHTLFILSNCTADYKKLHTENFKLNTYFEEFYDAESFGYIPKHEIFTTIRNTYPGEYAVIGDRFSDLEVAYKHNLLSIGCLYGFPEDGELDDANHLITDISQILSIL